MEEYCCPVDRVLLMLEAREQKRAKQPQYTNENVWQHEANNIIQIRGAEKKSEGGNYVVYIIQFGVT